MKASESSRGFRFPWSRAARGRTSAAASGLALIAVVAVAPAALAAPPRETEVVEPGELKQMEIEELAQVEVSTISRLEERLDLAPGTIYVYPRELIQQRGYRSLRELLQTVPGFTVFHRDWQYVVGVRGLNANDNDKMSLLVNGQRVLGLHEQDLLNGPINLDNVRRVEVVVGPSSLFQQADTLAATVNVITKETHGVEVLGATGTALPYSATLMAGHRFAPDRTVGFSFTLEQKKGFDAWPNPSRPYLPGRKLTGQLRFPSYFGVLNGRYQGLSAQAVAFRSTYPELHMDGFDPRNRGQVVDDFYSLLLRHERPWTDHLRTVLSLEAAMKGQLRENAGGPPNNATAQAVKQRQYRADLSLRSTGLGRHQIQAGAQLSYDDNYDTWFTYDDTSGPVEVHIPRTTIVDEDTLAVGFYADDELSLTDTLKLVAGVRIDQNQRLKGNRWFPGWRSAVVYQPWQAWIAKLAFYRAVRMPSPFQSLNKIFGTNNPNTPKKPAFANLSPTADKPEVLTTIELQNIFYVGPVRLGLTLYHQDLVDFITWFQPHSNGGDFRGNGAELSLHGSLDPRFTLWGNAAWNDSQLHLFRPDVFGTVSNTPESFHAYVNNDDRIIGSARYTGNLGFDWEVARWLLFSPSLRYFTGQAAVEFRLAEEGGPRLRTIRHRAYLDATVSTRNLKPVKGLELGLRLSGNNLTNNREPVGAQLFGDVYLPRGISAVLSIEVRFAGAEQP